MAISWPTPKHRVYEKSFAYQHDLKFNHKLRHQQINRKTLNFEKIQTICAPDLLQTLKIIPQLHVQGVGDDLGEATVLVILLPVQEPVWDLELPRVSDDHHQVLKLGRGQLTGPGNGLIGLGKIS
jgi:hypothetical protein